MVGESLKMVMPPRQLTQPPSVGGCQFWSLARFHSSTTRHQLRVPPTMRLDTAHSRLGPKSLGAPTHCSVKYTFLSGNASCTFDRASMVPAYKWNALPST